MTLFAAARLSHSALCRCISMNIPFLIFAILCLATLCRSRSIRIVGFPCQCDSLLCQANALLCCSLPKRFYPCNICAVAYQICSMPMRPQFYALLCRTMPKRFYPCSICAIAYLYFSFPAPIASLPLIDSPWIALPSPIISALFNSAAMRSFPHFSIPLLCCSFLRLSNNSLLFSFANQSPCSGVPDGS